MSLSKQLLDVLLIRKGPEPLECRLPDGFDKLVAYNLLTFKSFQDKLSVWTLQELAGHYVNLRKQVSPSMGEDQLLPESDFRLYAISARFPQQLASAIRLEPVERGAYDVQVLTTRIRVIVANQLPQEEHNALLRLFSSSPELLRFGVRHYRIRSDQTSTLLFQLIERYRQEGQLMPDLLEQMYQDTIERLLKELPIERRLAGLTPEQLLAVVSPEDRLKGLSVEKRLEGLPPERLLQVVSPEDRLKGLSPEELLKGLSKEQLAALRLKLDKAE